MPAIADFGGKADLRINLDNVRQSFQCFSGILIERPSRSGGRGIVLRGRAQSPGSLCAGPR